MKKFSFDLSKIKPKRKFECDCCGGVFNASWSKADAECEMKELWGALPEEEQATLCDDCFEEFMRRMKDFGKI